MFKNKYLQAIDDRIDVIIISKRGDSSSDQSREEKEDGWCY